MTLLILAAITDLRERRIPNWLNAGVAALYPVYLLLSPVPVAWPGALAISLLVGLLGLVLFARELIGGGDVKLITAFSLWAGIDHFTLFALVTTLTGGVVGLRQPLVLALEPADPCPSGRLRPRRQRRPRRAAPVARGRRSRSPARRPPRRRRHPPPCPTASRSPPAAWRSSSN